MRLALILALAASAYGQARWEHPIVAWQALKAAPAVSSPAVEPQSAPPVTARFVPVSLAAAAPQTGSGREAGAWHAEVCNRSSVRHVIPLPMVMETAPAVRAIPVEFQEALLDQRTKRSPWRIAGDVLMIGGTALVLVKLPKESKSAWDQRLVKIGFGLQAGIPIAQQVLGPKIAAAPVYRLPNPCPATIDVQPGACAECNILASLVRGAATIGPNPVRLP